MAPFDLSCLCCSLKKFYTTNWSQYFQSKVVTWCQLVRFSLYKSLIDLNAYSFVLNKNVNALLDYYSFTMHGSSHSEYPTTFSEIHCSCDKVYHKQEERFLFYILGQIVIWQYIPNPLDYNWQGTVINDHDWQLWNCPLYRCYFKQDTLHLSFIIILIQKYCFPQSCIRFRKHFAQREIPYHLYSTTKCAGNIQSHFISCYTDLQSVIFKLLWGLLVPYLLHKLVFDTQQRQYM